MTSSSRRGFLKLAGLSAVGVAGAAAVSAKTARSEGVEPPATTGKRLALVIDHPRPFIRSDDYFGPDRRRRHDPKYAGPWRRASDAGEIRSVEL